MRDQDDIVRWPDGTEATWGEVQRGEYDWMSDDYEIIPFDADEAGEECSSSRSE